MTSGVFWGSKLSGVRASRRIVAGSWKSVNATAREVCHVTLATGSEDQSEVSWFKTGPYVRFWHPLIWNVSLGAGAGLG